MHNALQAELVPTRHASKPNQLATLHGVAKRHHHIFEYAPLTKDLAHQLVPRGHNTASSRQGQRHRLSFTHRAPVNRRCLVH